MATCRLIPADELDYEGFTALQRAAFAEVLTEMDTSNDYMTPAFYRWKYRTPAGRALIAAVYEGDTLVATNAMFPLILRQGSRRLFAWQSCDTATLPSARGRGYFSLCLETLKRALSPGQIFFGFPNRNSRHGFRGLGCLERAQVTTWITPTWTLLRGSVGRLRSVERFDSGQDAFAERIAQEWDDVHIERSAAYLNWRYVDHPVVPYGRFTHVDERGQMGLIVLRTARVLGREVGLVMDLWGHQAGVERRLLRAARRWGGERDASLVVLLDSGLRGLDAVLSAVSPVPRRLLPKDQVLMGFVHRAAPEAGTALPPLWRVQTGDWDAF
jgi:hypothetical protein